MEWPLWRILAWAEHFAIYPPLIETGDILAAIIDRIEAVAGAKQGQRTKRWNVSRFFRKPKHKDVAVLRLSKAERLKTLRSLKINKPHAD